MWVRKCHQSLHSKSCEETVDISTLGEQCKIVVTIDIAAVRNGVNQTKLMLIKEKNQIIGCAFLENRPLNHVGHMAVPTSAFFGDVLCSSTTVTAHCSSDLVENLN